MQRKDNSRIVGCGIGFFTGFKTRSNRPIAVSNILQKNNLYTIEEDRYTIRFVYKILKQSKIIGLTSPKNITSQRVLEKA